jgi:hypothetical protein
MIECPRCGYKIDVLGQLTEWFNDYGDDAGPPIFTNIWCDGCDTQPMSWFLEKNGNPTFIETTDDTFGGKDIILEYPEGERENNPGDGKTQ